MKLTVVGSGYVGLVSAACFAELGHEVISVDNDLAKTTALQRGDVPIHEQYLPELLARHRGRSISVTSNLPEAVTATDIIFVAVGTPESDDGYADLSYVDSVARDLARGLNGHKLVVEKSTVPVFTHEWIRRVMLLNGAPAEAFDVASNPEFLREGTAVTDFLYPDRIVLGVDSERAAALLRDVYRPLTGGSYYRSLAPIPAPGKVNIPRLVETSAESAELIKHACNAYLAMKISFINAVANICESVGADVRQVCEGIGADSRIGPGFLSPGIGYGGSCFPKDLKAFRAVAHECGYDFRLLEEVIKINDEQRRRFLLKVRKALWTLRGKRLAALGLAFKGGTDDIRESPAIAIVQMLLKEGCEIRAYDPAAMERAREVLPSSGVTYCNSPYEAASGADALLILTEWPEFASLELDRLRIALEYPIIIDGRNLYDPSMMAQRGFLYHSIGRPDVQPAPRAAKAAR